MFLAAHVPGAEALMLEVPATRGNNVIPAA